MTIVTSTTFRSGNSEALRLPREIAYGAGVELEIERTGDLLFVRPKPRMTNKMLVEALRKLGRPADGVQERDLIEPPDRPGL